MYNEFKIKEEILELSKKITPELNKIFADVDEIAEYNSLKVLLAFQKYNLSEMHFRWKYRLWKWRYRKRYY